LLLCDFRIAALRDLRGLASIFREARRNPTSLRL
jgi:hypothetical protein